MKDLISEIKSLITLGLTKYPLPYKAGNAIRIGPVVVRQRKDKTYLLFDCKKDTAISSAHSKHGALAIAKLYNEDKSIQEAIKLDNSVGKYDADIMFYENSYNITNDDFKKDVLDARISVAQIDMDSTIDQLEQIIFS